MKKREMFIPEHNGVEIADVSFDYRCDAILFEAFYSCTTAEQERASKDVECMTVEKAKKLIVALQQWVKENEVEKK